MTFDAVLFSAAIQSRILHDELSLREVAKEIGISASTLSRLANGESPDIESFSTVVRWLNADANRFLNAVPGNMLEDAWTGLYLSLQELAVPAELIEALVTIIRLIRNKGV